MHIRVDRGHRVVPVILGVVTLVGVGALLTWDVDPALFPAKAHDLLASFPLAMIAIAYLAHKIAHRPRRAELAKAILLAFAFLFWAANQFWSTSRHATLFNDIAIALFVLDVFIVMIGWPSADRNEAFAETLGDNTR